MEHDKINRNELGIVLFFLTKVMNSTFFCKGMSHIIGLTLNYIKFGKKRKKGMSMQSLTIILNLEISNLG